MSSWNSYIDNLVHSGLDKAAICCSKTGASWACSPNFNATGDEAQTLIKGFSNPGIFQASGVRWNGQKYLYLQSDDKQVQAKYQETGLSIAKCNQCILIGHYAKNEQAGNARSVIEKMRDYLMGLGY